MSATRAGRPTRTGARVVTRLGRRPATGERSRSGRGLTRRAAPLTAVLVGAVMLLAALPAGADHPADVGLGTADSFAVLAGSTITNTGPTTITGDVGLDPGTAVTGFGPGADSVTLLGGGTTHIDDAVAEGAKADLVTAYNDAAGRATTQTVSADLGGSTLVAGVYTSASSLGLTGTLTLNGGGNPDAQFIFQAGSTLITASNSQVLLINGAQACHVVWQVTSSATFGTGTQFVGDVLALTSITATTAATFQGRLLARNGAVTLDTNTITRSTCATAATTTTTGGGTSTTSTTAGGTGGTSGTATTSPPATPGPTAGGGGTAPAGGSPAGAPGSPGGSSSGSPGVPSSGTPGTPSGPPSLPVTGMPDTELVTLGLALLALGILMLVAERRSRDAHVEPLGTHFVRTFVP